MRCFGFLATIFLFASIAAFAYPDEGSPLRHFPPNSLITEQNLEQALTQRYIAQYTSQSGIDFLNSVMERGSLYLPFIMEEVERRGLPPELIYLPVIESNFVSTARSRAGAVGLWQFMMNSISPFDIRVTDSVDERRDIIKSTRGALAKLEDNYRAMGNWELALAAYNAGLGGVTGIVRRTGISDYWELSRRSELKQETVHYVPKLIAAAYVLSQPERFGLDSWQASHEWTAIPLNRQVSLDIIAAEAGVDRELLRRLNAELLHGITPVDPNHRLKIPTAYMEQINLVLERDDLVLIRYHYHVVRYGDTLWSMSRHYGVTLASIEQHNPGSSARYLRLGETIIIPASRDMEAPAARTASVHSFDGQHLVVRGDTLWSLSRIYGVDPEALADANGMGLNQTLREGRTLRVPIVN